MLSIFSSAYFLWSEALVILIWLGWLTYLVISDKKKKIKLAGMDEQKDLSELLNEIKKKQISSQEEINKLKSELAEELKNGEFKINRVGLVRFNPYSDTGGQQSFAVALLDKKNNGIVLSYLYGRTGARLFSKKIKTGKSEDIELTTEEIKAIEIAN